MHSLTQQALQLPISERIKLVEEIWDSIAEKQGDVPIPQEHIEELERRLANDHSSGEPWEKVKTEIRRK